MTAAQLAYVGVGGSEMARWQVPRHDRGALGGHKVQVTTPS